MYANNEKTCPRVRLFRLTGATTKITNPILLFCPQQHWLVEPEWRLGAPCSGLPSRDRLSQKSNRVSIPAWTSRHSEVMWILWLSENLCAAENLSGQHHGCSSASSISWTETSATHATVRRNTKFQKAGGWNIFHCLLLFTCSVSNKHWDVLKNVDSNPHSVSNSGHYYVFPWFWKLHFLELSVCSNNLLHPVQSLRRRRRLSLFVPCRKFNS